MVAPDVLVVMVTVGEFTFGPPAGLKAGVATDWAISALAAKGRKHASARKRNRRSNGMGGEQWGLGTGTVTTNNRGRTAEHLWNVWAWLGGWRCGRK